MFPVRTGEMARRAIDAGGMTAVPIRSAKRGAQSKVTNLLAGRAGLRGGQLLSQEKVNPLAVSICTVWLKEAAFFGDFLCSRKESYPPRRGGGYCNKSKLRAAAARSKKLRIPNNRNAPETPQKPPPIARSKKPRRGTPLATRISKCDK
jgi:hypothetical protein